MCTLRFKMKLQTKLNLNYVVFFIISTVNKMKMAAGWNIL